VLICKSYEILQSHREFLIRTKLCIALFAMLARKSINWQSILYTFRRSTIRHS